MSGHRISIAAIATERFWQVAVLTAAGSIGFTSHADAAVYYWGDYPDFGYYRPGPPAQPRKQKTRRNSDPKTAVVEKETFAKPQGPLIIAISIEQQKVRVFDANGFFAESPVSTGTKTHPTPMGVFSIIQKHKLHHSNIYSGAPMPFMQRITWSGVAMHAGVLPGYPASHGCIRMPLAFAQKMWNWTRMGARVIVTPGEITPASFSHPLLVTQKTVPPQPTAFEEPKADAPLAVKSDKGADARSVLPSADDTRKQASNCDRRLATVRRRRAIRPAPPTPAARCRQRRARRRCRMRHRPDRPRLRRMRLNRSRHRRLPARMPNRRRIRRMSGRK